MKEPQKARFTSDKAIIKDHFYYKGNEFSWNRPARVDNKYYSFYLKQQDENLGKIQAMKNQEIEDKRKLEDAHKAKVIFKKAQVRSVFESRIREREAIQKICSQTANSQSGLEISQDSSRIVNGNVSKKLNSGRALRSDEFSWNILTQASKKNVDIFLGSYSIKGEENMIKRLKEKTIEEELGEETKRKKSSAFHKTLREMFLSKQSQNRASQERVSGPTTKKLVEYKKEYSGGQNIVSPNAPKASQSFLTQVVERLAISRENSKREFNVENNECNGMLVRNMADMIYSEKNDFHEALRNQSKVFQDIQEQSKNQSRPNTSKKITQVGSPSVYSNQNLSLRPQTARLKAESSLSPYLMENISSAKNNFQKETITNKTLATPKKSRSEEEEAEKKAAMKEIAKFDLFQKSEKKAGYARVTLEQAYSLSTSQGLIDSGRIELKRKGTFIK